MNKISLLVLGCFCLIFAGCETVEKYGSSGQYKNQIETAKPIEVPQGLSSSKLDTYYKIPAVKSYDAKTKVSILPPGSKVKK